MKIDIGKIDWDMLREQKSWLLTQDNKHAEGIVNLIDRIQDEAVDNGDASKIEVFGVYPEEN